MKECDHVNACARRGALRLFGGASLFAGLSALLGAPPAQAKTSKAGAAYQASPNGRQRCANCSWFEPPSGCGVVGGAVNANGWCNLWG
jgi:hypothetical protein